MHHLYLFYRWAESKKEIANRYYSQKLYKKALIGYNEVVGNILHCIYSLFNITLHYSLHLLILCI